MTSKRSSSSAVAQLPSQRQAQETYGADWSEAQGCTPMSRGELDSAVRTSRLLQQLTASRVGGHFVLLHRTSRYLQCNAAGRMPILPVPEFLALKAGLARQSRPCGEYSCRRIDCSQPSSTLSAEETASSTCSSQINSSSLARLCGNILEVLPVPRREHDALDAGSVSRNNLRPLA